MDTQHERRTEAEAHDTPQRRLHDSDHAPLDEYPAMTPEAADGADPISMAYDLMFEMAEILFARSGRLRQELIGFQFQDRDPMLAKAVWVEQSADLSYLMKKMLEQWPVVAHIFQGWSIPDSSPAGRTHGRCEVVVIALHTPTEARMATCRVERDPVRSLHWPEGAQAPSVSMVKGQLRPMPGVRNASTGA